MKGRYLALIFASLVAFTAVSALRYEVSVINNTIYAGNDLYYNITFTADRGPQQNIVLRCDPLKTRFSGIEGEVSYTSCSITPSKFTVEPFKGSQSVLVRIGVPEQAFPDYGVSKRNTIFSIIAEDTYHKTIEDLQLTARILGELPSIIVEVPVETAIDYSKVSLYSVSFPISISDTRNPAELTLIIDNQLRERIETDVEIRLMRGTLLVQKITDKLNIEGVDKTTYIKEINLGETLSPDAYYLDIKIMHNANVVLSKKIYFDIAGYSEINENSVESISIFGKTVEVTLENEGTATGVKVIEKPMNFIERILTVGSIEGAQITGNAIVWEVPLDSGETKKVGYKVTFIPILILPFIIAALGYMFWWSNRGVVIEKSLTEKKQAEHATEGKMVVKFKNIAKQPFRDVKVIEKIPEFVSHVGDFSPAKPEIRKIKSGHELVWKIDKMTPKEERIFTYKVKTKLGLLGNIKLPASQIKFYNTRGKLKTRKSNKISFIGEYKN
ncbi:MAG: hypothetical protein PHW96_02000 [Candidatus Nanoarchaeia archaeon]|nr:hypothetical protein [Candidatus Nanoarchaeia archaeon]